MQLAVGTPPGVWVCSTDMLLNIPRITGNVTLLALAVISLTLSPLKGKVTVTVLTLGVVSLNPITTQR